MDFCLYVIIIIIIAITILYPKFIFKIIALINLILFDVFKILPFLINVDYLYFALYSVLIIDFPSEILPKDFIVFIFLVEFNSLIHPEFIHLIHFQLNFVAIICPIIFF